LKRLIELGESGRTTLLVLSGAVTPEPVLELGTIGVVVVAVLPFTKLALLLSIVASIVAYLVSGFPSMRICTCFIVAN